MVGQYSIKCDNVSDIYEIPVEYGGLRKTYTIICDETEDLNNFNMDYYGDDGIVVNRNRCQLDVYIKPNTTQEEKEYTILCTHSNDRNIYLQIVFKQVAEEFSISVNKEIITFKSILDKNCEKENGFVYYETKTINVNVIGGSKKFRILSIYGYNSDKTTQFYFDNGFIYQKKENELILKSYGRIFMEDKCFYEIVLCHNDDKTIRTTLKIEYDEVNKQTTSNKIKKRASKKKPLQQISDIYLPYKERMALLENNNEENIIMTVDDYDIKFNSDIGEEIVVSKQGKTSIPFIVTKNNEECNLMVKIYTSAIWCKAVTDDTNRNLVMTILNKPLGTRKCLIRVAIVDKPEITKSFILKNVP